MDHVMICLSSTVAKVSYSCLLILNAVRKQRKIQHLHLHLHTYSESAIGSTSKAPELLLMTFVVSLVCQPEQTITQFKLLKNSVSQTQ